MLNARILHPKRSGFLANRVTPHNAPADQLHTAGNMGKVSQYMKSGEAAKLVPAIKPVSGLRPISLQKRMKNMPAKKQVKRARAVINCHGSPVNCAITHEGR